MSDGEMIDEDISPPPQQSQGFNIADVLSTGSCSSIGQDSLDVGDTSPHLEINRKSDFSVDEASALENLKRLYPFVDQNQTPLPRYWSPTDKFKSLVLSNDCLRVHYAGKRDTQKDAAAIRANTSIPRNCAVYYFEITVVRKGDTGYLGIGLCEKNVSVNRLPGWDCVSYGYHGDDGNFFASSGKGRDYGPKFTTNDIVGCGINFVTRTIFFTKNGQNIGVAATGISIEKALYPMLGMQAKDQIVDTNFGQHEFTYNIDLDIKESELKTLNHIQSIQLPSDKSIWMTKLIADWLNNYGYSKTLAQFNEATLTVYKEKTEVLDERRQIMQLINDGKISEAIRRANILAPQVLQENKLLALQLKIQEFVQIFALIKSGDFEAYSEYLQTNQDEDVSMTERASPPIDILASTSTLNPTRNKRSAPESVNQQGGTAKRRSDERRFTTNSRRSTRNSQQAGSVDDSQNGRAFENPQNQTNGRAEDHSTNGLSTNGNAHISSTNGATPPTSTNIIAEMDDDEYSYSSDFSSSGDSDWEMDNLEIDKSKDSFGFPHEQFSTIVSMGQKISKFAATIPDVPSDLIKRMDDAFSMVCYDDPLNCPKTYLFQPEYRKYLANFLNSAIIAVTNKDALSTPESFIQKATELRQCALQMSTVGAIYSDEKRIFAKFESLLDGKSSHS